jgi:tRNA(Ile2) C34 agmatinyltransferase TiaS
MGKRVKDSISWHQDLFIVHDVVSGNPRDLAVRVGSCRKDEVSRIKGVLPIAHHVVMLNQDVFSKTAGNSASFIEVAVEPKKYTDLLERTKKFVAGESLSAEWGIAVKAGFTVPAGLREYGKLVREQIISRVMAEATAEQYGVLLHGGNGVIGALGAVALSGLSHEILLDPTKPIPLT